LLRAPKKLENFAGRYFDIYLLTEQRWDEAGIEVVVSIATFAGILAQTQVADSRCISCAHSSLNVITPPWAPPTKAFLIGHSDEK
jgi:hypothetical protein